MDYRICWALVASFAFAGPAIAGPTYESGNGGTVTWYGQFNPAYQYVDDGTNTHNEIVDSTRSNSRVGLQIRQPLDGYAFGFDFETGLGLRPSSRVSQTSTPDWFDWDRTDLRKIDFFLSSDWGKISVGQGSTAGDGVATMDKSGTTLAIASQIADIAGGFSFTGGGPTISSAFVNLDGGRKGRVRYDSPSYSGFTVSASWGTEVLKSGNNDDVYDVAVRYGGDLGNGAKVQAGVAYIVNEKTSGDTKDVVGSATFLMPSGVSFTMAAGNRDTTGTYFYGKAGYTAKLLAVGDTSFGIDYYTGDDLVSNGSVSESFGIGAVQKFDDVNVEAYVGYRKYSYSDTTTSYNDISSIIAGARWKF